MNKTLIVLILSLVGCSVSCAADKPEVIKPEVRIEVSGDDGLTCIRVPEYSKIVAPKGYELKYEEGSWRVVHKNVIYVLTRDSMTEFSSWTACGPTTLINKLEIVPT